MPPIGSEPSKAAHMAIVYVTVWRSPHGMERRLVRLDAPSGAGRRRPAAQ